MLAVVASGIGIWQVDEHVYSTEAIAENYWEALRAGDGSAAVGMFSSLPELNAAVPQAQSVVLSAADEDEDPADEDPADEDPGESPDEDTGDDSDEPATEDEAGDTDEDTEEDADTDEVPDEDRLALGSVDSVLLDGEALRHSAGQLEGLSITERSDGADLAFTVDGEPHESHVPMSREGSSWLFFDDWKLEPEALTEVQLSVPAAELGGIGQIEVNEQPVNLHEDGATLAAFVPSVIDVDIDSDWLSGSAREVVVADGEHSVEIDLEASETAAQLLHDEVEEYLTSCADQQVLMPSGCPMGVQTPNSVDASTISWEMPDPADIALTFDDDGWSVTGASSLSATVTFESLDHFDGDELDESHDISFGLDIQVSASGEDLVVSVIGD
ncbi:hypothetical protein [Nesterenkonia xinjiangensis]|uniref:Uncharacterized protein n=1 Tax=Nesterenkonia xinjiangensis TaxID=225327 RepID=A0A7Z0GMY0_9MICC|nr:hypothetical protein [Nesterenkonia xinjiangensis]NYJ78444.1 hypothetical protein [Nesterenkonia xinjiangensis]